MWNPIKNLNSTTKFFSLEKNVGKLSLLEMFKALLKCLLNIHAVINNSLGATQDMLNGMVTLMTNSHEPFDPAFYERLVNCLNKIEEPRLLKAVDAQWQGFLDYSNTHGTESGPWPTCNDETMVINLNKVESLYLYYLFIFS